MDKKNYHLKDEPNIFDTKEPLIKWIYHLDGDAIATPDFSELIYQFYFENCHAYPCF